MKTFTPQNEYRFGIHYHDYYEFHYVLKGRGLFYIDDVEYPIEAGDLVTCNIFRPHGFVFNSGCSHERLSVSFNYNFIVSFDTDNNSFFSIFHSNAIKSPLVHVDKKQQLLIEDIVRRNLEANKIRGEKTMRLALCLEFLVTAFNAFYNSDMRDYEQPKNVDIVGRLVYYINNHINGDLSLEILSKEVALSKCYLCRVFKSFTGKTLYQYIVSKRVETAKTLILQGIPLSQVVEMSGFCNYSYFFRVFKATTGLSPSHYLKKQKIGEYSSDR